MASIPRPSRLLPALVVLGLVVAAGTGGAHPGPEGGKPQAGVGARWVLAAVPVPGGFADARLEVSTRFPVERLRIEVLVPPGIETAGPPPAYDGPLEPGSPLVLPLTVRVPAGAAPPVRARITVESGAGTYRTGASLDLSPRRDESPEAHGARVVRSPRGDLLEFPAAVRAAAPSVRPRSYAPGAFPVTLTGRFFYRDRVFDPNGFVNANTGDDPLRPIRHANVDLLVNGAYQNTVSTDTTGTFLFTYNGTAEDTYQVRVLSACDHWGGTDIRVKRSSGQPTLYSVAPPASKPGGSADFGDFIAEPGSGGEAFNVLDCCLEGAELVRSLTGSYPSHPVSIYWNADPGYQGTFYAGWAIQLFGGDDPQNPDEEGYDDCVIIHEYGHYIADLYSKLNPAGGQHFIDDSNQPPILSWNEGWASYFQAAARARAGDPYPSWYVDLTDQPGAGQLSFSYDIEGPSIPLKGTGSEVVVQAALWDIEDGPSTPDPQPGVDDDPLTLSRSLTWSVVSSWPASGPSVTLESFWDSWFSPSFAYGHQPEMETVFGALGAEFYEDTFEGDDTPARANPLEPDGIPAHHTFYPAGDVDYHRMNLVAGDEVSIETLNILSYGDTKLEIYDPAQSLIASNDNRTGVDLSSFVGFTAPTTGSYLVKVLRGTGNSNASQVRYGSYDIRALRAVLNPVSLVSAASAAGVADVGYGVGLAFADADGDGAPDLYVVNNTAYGDGYAADVFYRNGGNGTFTNATASAGLGHPEGGVAAAWGDFNNDGHPDLFVTDHGLFANQGNAQFTDVTAASGVTDIGREFDAAWVDADNDGRLDLFVLRRDGPSALWHNRGDGTFTDVAPQAGFDFPADGADAYGCAWADYDGDRLPDLFVVRLKPPYHSLYHNLGDDRFEDVTAAAGVAGTDAAHGAVWGDLNNDGRVDLFVASSGSDALYLNRGDGTFEEVGAAWGINDPGTAVGAALADVDLDGDLDLYVVNLTSPNILFQNLGSAMLRMSGTGVPSPDSGPDYGCAWADVDRDGDPDLYVTRGAGSPNLLYRSALNDGASPRPWLGVQLQGVLSNRDGIGARIEVHSGGLVQTRQVGTGTGWASKSRLPELFGFPDGAVVDSVNVFWPTTARNVVRNPALGAVLHITEDPSTPVLPPPVTPAFTVRLAAPSPNPFIGATGVSFDLTAPADVRAEIFDLAGRKVRTLIDRRMEAGRQIAGWDGLDDWGRPAPPGVYFYRLQAGGESRVRKLVRLAR